MPAMFLKPYLKNKLGGAEIKLIFSIGGGMVNSDLLTKTILAYHIFPSFEIEVAAKPVLIPLAFLPEFLKSIGPFKPGKGAVHHLVLNRRVDEQKAPSLAAGPRRLLPQQFPASKGEWDC